MKTFYIYKSIGLNIDLDNGSVLASIPGVKGFKSFNDVPAAKKWIDER